MKYCFLFLCSLAMNHLCSQQLLADAGPNIMYCSDSIYIFQPPAGFGYAEKDTLGGMPTARGGKPPYTYRWHGAVENFISNPPFRYASYFLDDTSSPNPKIKEIPYACEVILYLDVIDRDSNISRDTVIIKKKCGIVTQIGGITAPLNARLSLTANEASYWGTKSVDWIPKHNIIQVIEDKYIIVKVDTLTIYYVKIIDNMYCAHRTYWKDKSVGWDGFASTVVLKNKDDLLLNFHNPVTTQSVFEINKWMDVSKVELYNSIGQRQNIPKFRREIPIGELTENNGHYYLLVYNQYHQVRVYSFERK